MALEFEFVSLAMHYIAEEMFRVMTVTWVVSIPRQNVERVHDADHGVDHSVH